MLVPLSSRGLARGLAVVAALAALAIPAGALAAVGLNGAPIHSGMNHPNNVNPLYISQADCKGPTTFTFAVTGLTISHSLSVWLTSTGTDCTQQLQRSGGTQTCFQVVTSQTVTNTSQQLPITSDLVANAVTGIKGCVDSTTGDSPRKVLLYFLIDAETAGNVTDSTKYEMTIDLKGPPPPTGLAPSTFDEQTLLVKFCIPLGTTDVAGFKIYCDATGASGARSSSADPVCSGTTTTASVTASSASSSSSSSAGGTTNVASSSSSVASSSASSSSAGGGGASSGSCSSSRIMAGTLPSITECGSVTSATATQINAGGFTLGKLGAVAIAGYDSVGNVGNLSALACGQTEQVTDFYEAYRAAGGQAGNGCSCGLGGEPRGPWATLAFAGGALALALRRRRGVRR